METVDDSIKKLMRGEILPIQEVGTSYLQKEHADNVPLFVPKVKKTVTYIVMAVLFDDNDRVVLVQEAKASCKGTWYLPAGRVEKGENLEDAVRREVLEEAGLIFEPISFISARVYSRWCRFVYVGKSIGVKREVLEEAGLQFEPLSLIGLEVSHMWYRYLFVGRAIGGKLKTLAEKDLESLQAGWFTIEQIEKGFVQLRAKDIIKPIRLAFDYIKKSAENRHPHSSILVQPHYHLVHRPVIYKQSSDGSVDILCYKKNGLHIPSCYICPTSYSYSFNESVYDILLSAFQVQLAFQVQFLGKVQVQGLLTVEHCGKPKGEHDGICFTTAVTFSSDMADSDIQCIETPRNSDFVWCSVTDSDLSSEFHRRVIQKNLLVPINCLAF